MGRFQGALVDRGYPFPDVEVLVRLKLSCGLLVKVMLDNFWGIFEGP